MSLDPVQVQWLSLVRYQADVAAEQSRHPIPLAMLAINGLHDAAESLIGLIIEVRSLTVQKKATFEQLHAAVRVKYPVLDHYGLILDRLNTARVNYKHHGHIVDESTIERARINTMDFLADATREALGMDFEQVSMGGLIASDPVREMVERAEQRWADGAGHDAAADLRRAFDRLCNLWEDTKSVPGLRGFYDTRPRKSVALHRRRASLGAFADSEAAYHAKWLARLDERTKLMMFGVDMRRFVYFDVHVPSVRYNHRNQPEGEAPPHDDDPLVTEDVFRRCHRFVIDTALQFARDDFDWNPVKYAGLRDRMPKRSRPAPR